MPTGSSRRIASRQAQLQKQKKGKRRGRQQNQPSVPIDSNAPAQELPEEPPADTLISTPKPKESEGRGSHRVNPQLLRYSYVPGELKRIAILGGSILAVLIGTAIVFPTL